MLNKRHLSPKRLTPRWSVAQSSVAYLVVAQ